MRKCHSVVEEGLSDVRCVVWRFPEGYGGHLNDPLEEDFEDLVDPEDPDCPLAEWYGDVVIMQATELLDRNGKENFEGDVVETPAGRVEVTWNRQTCGFDPFRGGAGGAYAAAECEIIGNAYQSRDNPGAFRDLIIRPAG
jgi:hypothetical protein